MANFNKVILAGNLTRDPQSSMTPNNKPVCEFGMAINRKWRTDSGEMREEVCFVDVVAYGRSAETLGQYMTKGKPLLVEGRLKYDQWEAKDGGGKRSKLRVVVDSFQFLGSGGGGGAGGGGDSEGGGGAARSFNRKPPAAVTPSSMDNYDDAPPMEAGHSEDNIPF
ncbi:MAG TPA: single-stranded DNA-binding protein [Phycisphaerae bacterium]|nr:single-stranded DNA-binding protein [Phycisphaerae bacterium]